MVVHPHPCPPPHSDSVGPPRLARGGSYCQAFLYARPAQECLTRPKTTIAGPAWDVLAYRDFGRDTQGTDGEPRQPHPDDARAVRPARADPERRVQARGPDVRAAPGAAARRLAHAAAARARLARARGI